MEEKTGYRLTNVEQVFEAYMSLGSVTERIYCLIAKYKDQDRSSLGGGYITEGEDIEVLENPLDKALQMIASGEIRDGKTNMLLQYAALHNFVDRPVKMDISGDS